jgi:RimJ/RimL family protein N-acetyltransferase
MKPVDLRTSRLVLDQPTLNDVDLIAEYCTDPQFETYLTTPWPYTRGDAVGFVEKYVATGWSTDREYTWALRSGREFVGIVGFRVERGDIGFWVGAPHRGNGYMTEAVSAIADWLFARGTARIEWFCLVGNEASASVARKAGFRFVGDRPTPHAHRGSGEHLAWFAELDATDSRDEKQGWPASP